MGIFCGSGVGNLIGDLLPFVCWGVIFLDVGAVDVEGGMVWGDVEEALGGLSWPYVLFPEVPGLNCLVGIRWCGICGFPVL